MSKINDLLQDLGKPIDSYHEWDAVKSYPFPVYRKQIGSKILVYQINSYKEKLDRPNEYEKIADDYYKEEIAKAKL